MSAEVLREAAADIRAKAEAATPGPWYDDSHGSRKDCRCVKTRAAGRGRDHGEFVAMYVTRDAEHIASWHPAVALAVAGWLESVANAERHEINGADIANALAVARTYLGRADA